MWPNCTLHWSAFRTATMKKMTLTLFAIAALMLREGGSSAHTASPQPQQYWIRTTMPLRRVDTPIQPADPDGPGGPDGGNRTHGPRGGPGVSYSKVVPCCPLTGAKAPNASLLSWVFVRSLPALSLHLMKNLSNIFVCSLILCAAMLHSEPVRGAQTSAYLTGHIRIIPALAIGPQGDAHPSRRTIQPTAHNRLQICLPALAAGRLPLHVEHMACAPVEARPWILHRRILSS